LVRIVEYSADGTLLLSGSNDHTVRIWEVSSGAQLHAFEHRAMVWCLRWLPDQPTRFAVADADSMHLCDATSGATIRAFDLDDRTVFTLCFSADGAWMVAGMNDGVRVFDVTCGRCVTRGLRMWLRNVRCCECMHAGCHGDGVGASGCDTAC